ncbi:MAG: phosphoribosylglycinamide formyltransferase [Bacillota bacterium]|jgi:phosphoribosylglycinamide formyltransferase-1
MSSPIRVAVFASGSGSNFQRIIDLTQQGKLNITLSLLVCDKATAGAIERANKAGIPTYVFSPKNYVSREAYEAEIVAELDRLGIDLIVLAGYMRLITNVLVDPFYGRMINIHPALLPAFPGAHGIEDAFNAGVTETGCTVHFVDNGMDTGPIIAQQKIEVKPDDTLETLSERMHKAEHQLYPEVIDWISKGYVKLDGRNVTVERP